MNSQRITKLRILFALLFLVPFSANSALPPGGELILHYGDYCQFVKINEMEYTLEWGKNNIKNISLLTFDTMEIRKCTLVMETDEFTVLKITEGPGTKKSIILPLNLKSREIIYQNALCVDLDAKTIILENAAQDTVLIVENFITKKKMVLGKDFIPCRSGFPRDCLDSLVFYNNKLTFKWITPDKHSKDKKIERKKFKISLK